MKILLAALFCPLLICGQLLAAQQTDTGLLVTSDPGCLMQMRANRPKESNLRIEHLAVVLEELSA